MRELTEQEKVWRAQYRAYRYLEYETPEQLYKRALNIAMNACAIDRFGNYSLRPGGRWTEMLAHVFEELGLRNITLPPLDLREYLRTARAAELWDSLKVPQGSYLLKFGAKEHIAAMVERGSFRIAPAESYDDPSLNTAIADKEYEFTEETVGGMIHVPPNSDLSAPKELWGSGPLLNTLKYTRTYTAYAYIACFASLYEYRLYEDFEYNACAVIRDPMRFLNALRAAGEKQLPGWQVEYGPVIYRDPFHPIKEDDVLYSKHFRYTYQCEYRVTWQHPPGMKDRLDKIFLELGPISEYCTLLTL